MDEDRLKYIAPDGLPIPEDFPDIVHALGWIGVIECPKLWRTLRRIPPKEHLVKLVEAYMRYAYGDRYLRQPKPRNLDRARWGAAVERLRDLLLAWEPPEMTPEIREAAREIDRVEGYATEPIDYDNIARHESSTISLEETLCWPEGRWDEAAYQAERAAQEK